MNNITIKEEWRDIEGYEDLYKISNLGRVKSLVGFNGHEYIKREKILKPSRQYVGNNYSRYIVNLSKNKKRKSFKIHRLVAKAFIPNIENKMKINHKDGNPLNNKVDNLEWCTQKENIIHAYETGLIKKFQISKEKLNELYNIDKKSMEEIGDIYGVANTTINRKLKEYGIKRRSISEAKIKYNLDKEFLINELKNKTQKQIADEIGCKPSLINHYLKRIKEKGKIYA